MMLRLLTSVFYLCLLLSANPAWALVNPEETTKTTPEWLAVIHLGSESSGLTSRFCMGSLIDARWVLSSRACFSDHFEKFDFVVKATQPRYLVQLPGESKLLEVETVKVSSDKSLVLLQLKTATDNTPIAMPFHSTQTLQGATAFLYSHHESQNVGDLFYNPTGTVRIQCTLNGQLYVDEGNYCYVISFPEYRSALLQTSGVIFDPGAANVELSDFDELEQIDTTGRKIYIDFAANNSYPCAEDIGSPIIREENGEAVQVGIVQAVGSAMLIGVCNASIVNNYFNLSHYEEFITRTLVLAAIEYPCPPKPFLTVQYTGNDGVRVSWSEVAGAVGYRALVSTADGHEPVQVIDLGAITEVNTTVIPGVLYTVGVQAYNSECNGPLSRRLSVQVPQ